MAMFRKREPVFDNLKLLCILLVVLIHVLCTATEFVGRWWYHALWGVIHSFTIPLFLVISGYLFKPRTLRYSLHHFVKPAICFGLVNIALAFAFKPGYTWLHALAKGGYAMWYIQALAVYYVVFSFLTVDIRMSFAVTSLLAILVGFGFVKPSVCNLFHYIAFAPFFVMGIWARQSNWLDKLKGCPRRAICSAAFVASLGAYVILSVVCRHVFYELPMWHVLGGSMRGFALRLLGYLLCAVMSVALIGITPNRTFAFTKYGSRSYAVYLTHMMVIFPIGWGLLPHLEGWMYFVVLIALPLLCLPLFHATLSTWVLKFCNEK